MKHIAYIATIIAIFSVISTVYTYTYYQGETAGMRSTISDLENQIASLRGELYKYRNLTLVDDGGYVLSLTSYPSRIISLAPSNTEILFAVGAGGKVVGVTQRCNYPYNFSAWIEAGNMTSVGDYWTPSIEVIVTLNPDLVLAAFDQDEAVNTLRGMGYKVLVLSPNNMDGILKNILLVGSVTDRNIEAALLINSLSHRIDAVVSKVANATSRPRVYYEVWYDPLWSVGSEGWENTLIEKAGGTNIFADQSINYFETSSEAIIERNPDIIIFPLGPGMGAFWGSFDQVRARPGWSTIGALQNNSLYTIDEDIIARPGPRIVDALETLAQIIHPELFQQNSTIGGR